MNDILSKTEAFEKAIYLFKIVMATSSNSCTITNYKSWFNVQGSYATKADYDCFYGLLIPHSLASANDNSFYSSSNERWILSIDIEFE